MRFNIIPTTWITILALAALLMSSFASSSMMMNNTAPFNEQTLESGCSNLPSMPPHHQNMMKPAADTDVMTAQCHVQTDIVHDCCDSTCATSVALFTAPNLIVTASTSLALFTPPLSGEVVHQTQSLYRPPIA